MTNPYYNHTDGIPIQLSRGASSPQRAEWDAVDAGFVLVRADMLARLPLSGGTVTGAVTFSGPVTFTNSSTVAITQPLGTNDTTIATMAALTAAINASAVNAGISSLTPSPNKIPLASSAGVINQMWVPYLAFCASVSGVPYGVFS